MTALAPPTGCLCDLDPSSAVDSARPRVAQARQLAGLREPAA